MKRKLALLLTVPVVLGCMSLPAFAGATSISSGMHTWYSGSSMVDRGWRTDINRSGYDEWAVFYKIWLKGDDGKKRGTRSLSIAFNYDATGYTFAVDHAYGNTVKYKDF
ncbi:MAG: hypothetical protein IKR22_06490 [Clostridiales bacterium]|nr:hypothetical protein [Clostridiales bacterium]